MPAKVRAIPEGYRSVTPHLVVRGAAKAVEWYKKALGAEEINRMPTPDGKLMHAEIRIGDSIVMMADEAPEMGGRSPQSLNGSPCMLNLYVEDADRAWKRAVDAGAKVKMPLGDMFWGDRYGQLVDPFGHEWSIAQHVRDVTPDEMAREAAKAFSPKK